VFTLDWHPEDNHWIATAGRDKAIKVSVFIISLFMLSTPEWRR
jgi:hypothetical protein